MFFLNYGKNQSILFGIYYEKSQEMEIKQSFLLLKAYSFYFTRILIYVYFHVFSYKFDTIIINSSEAKHFLENIYE